MLPPTQQRPAESQMSEAALKARLSPALSLFNRLDGLVLQLESTRDFFVEWPQQICQRIRRVGGGSEDLLNVAHRHQQHHTRRGGHSEASNLTAPITSGECWNGRDFSGYTKPLAQFGYPISSGHPEVAVPQTQPISPIILNLVARLKETGAQLARKSIRTPMNPLDLMQLTMTLSKSGTNSAEAQGPASPLAEARVSGELYGKGSQEQQQQQHQQQQLLAAKMSALVASSQAAGELDEHQVRGADNEAAASAPASSLAAYPSDSSADSGEDSAEEAPDGDAAESDGDGDGDSEQGDSEDDSYEEAGEQDGDQGDDDYVPQCRVKDCLDLLTQNNYNNNNHQQIDPNGEVNFHGNNNNVHHPGAGSTTLSGPEAGEQQTAGNNNVPHHNQQYHHNQHQHQHQNHHDQYGSAATPGGVDLLTNPVPIVNVPSNTIGLLDQQQQQPAAGLGDEIYPLDPASYNSMLDNIMDRHVPSSSSASVVVVVARLAQLDGPIASHLLLFVCSLVWLLVQHRQHGQLHALVVVG